MIGNDVVDLSFAKKNTRYHTQAFQEKVFHTEEIKSFGSFPLPSHLFWKLWSIKETAYKAHQRRFTMPQKLNPFSFQVQSITDDLSMVKKDAFIYKVLSYQNSDWVYSMLANSQLQSYQNFDIKTTSSFFYPKLTRHDLNHKVIKNQWGIPFIQVNNNLHPISITHHGKYMAYVVEKNS